MTTKPPPPDWSKLTKRAEARAARIKAGEGSRGDLASALVPGPCLFCDRSFLACQLAPCDDQAAIAAALRDVARRLGL